MVYDELYGVTVDPLITLYVFPDVENVYGKVEWVMDYESNEDFLKDLMDQIYFLHKENARLMLKIEELEKHNEELNRKLKSIQALFLWNILYM